MSADRPPSDLAGVEPRYHTARANRDGLARLGPMLEAMWRQDLDRLAEIAEADEMGRQ
jgi:hypothetical protein